MIKWKQSFVLLASLSLLLGCGAANSTTGASGSSSSSEENISEVDKLLDLMSTPCTSANAQQTVFVKETSENYMCLVIAAGQGAWYPTVSKQSDLAECSAALNGRSYYVTEKTDIYVCFNGEWSATNSELGSSSSNSSETPSSSADVSSSGTAPVVSSSSATAAKVVTFEEGILWTPSYGRRARTFFNTVDEYTFWSSNVITRDSSGWWEKYSDAVDHGSSVVSGSFESDYLALNVTLNYGGWHKVGSGLSAYNAPEPYPYGGFQFPLAPVEGGYTDLSSWAGVCVTYSSTEPFAFAVRSAQTDLGDGMHWEAAVPASSSVTTVEIDFNDLTRSIHTTTVVSRADAIEKATGFQFAFRNDEAGVECTSTYVSSCGEYGISNNIKLYKIGKTGNCGSSSGGGGTL